MAAQRHERAANVGGYYATKLPRGIEPLPRMVSQDPLRQAYGQGFDEEGSCTVSDWIGYGRHGRRPLIAC